MGPAKTMPTRTSIQRSENGMPEATTPQPKAHIGGNHVMGLSNSATVASEGREGLERRSAEDMLCILMMTLQSVNSDLHPDGQPRFRLGTKAGATHLPSGPQVAQAVTAQLDVKALARKAQHLGC